MDTSSGRISRLGNSEFSIEEKSYKFSSGKCQLKFLNNGKLDSVFGMAHISVQMRSQQRPVNSGNNIQFPTSFCDFQLNTLLKDWQTI